MRKVKIYKSGFTLVVQRNKKKSIAFAINVGVGSVNEKTSEYGYSHFLEHLMFKSTKNRTTNQIAEESDFLGVRWNANTNFTKTRYYFEVLNKNFEKMTEIMADMFLNGVLNEDEFNMEKNVVIEEIKRAQDNSARLVLQLICREFYKNTPFEHLVIGTQENIESATPEKIRDYRNRNYKNNRIIISIAGDISMHKAKKIVEKYFAPLLEGEEKPQHCITFNGTNKIGEKISITEKDENQTKVVIEFKGIDYYSPEYYIQTVYANILGSGMSSRLYQRLRTELGLAYSVYADYSTLLQSGCVEFAIGTRPENVATAMKEMRKVIADVAENGVTATEVEKQKNKIQTNLIVNNRERGNTFYMSKNASEIYIGKNDRTDKEIWKLVDNVTVEDVNKFAKMIQNSKDYVITAVGKNVNKKDLELFLNEKPKKDVVKKTPRKKTTKTKVTKKTK